MPASKHIERVTLLLVVLSAALLQVALDARQPGAGVPLLMVSAAIALVTCRLVSRSNAADWQASSVAAIVLLGGLPFVWDPAARLLLSVGEPIEVQMAYSLRNLMLGIAAVQQLPRARGLAALSSLFLVVVGFLWVSNGWTTSLLVAYAVVGMWWLVGTYWELLGGRFADDTEPSAPIRPAVLAIVLIAVVTAALAPLAGWSPATTALNGFFPSSGGVRWNDPFAHGGVGDGDQMVAAKENASSFGPIESELFLESEMPSLYDAFNEFSEATPKKLKQARRAIPLAPSMGQTNHEKKGLTQQATREFSTVRQQTQRRSITADHLSAALLLVAGRTPAHLALETFDRWDGRSLIASESGEPLNMKLRDPDPAGRRWVDLMTLLPSGLFPSQTETQVRVVNLRTDRVPTPANPLAVTMDKLHAASMFTYASDGALAMNVEHIPQLTILRIRSALRSRSAQPNLPTIAPEGGSPVVAEIARAWTAGVQPGWAQVEAVLRRLRTEYEHDQTATVPDTVDDAVEHFLVEAKQGPDYLFAASAAVLLRSLGYETRVRGGLYASPERYDRVSGLTTVLAEDAHFWVEVRSNEGAEFTAAGETKSGVWITLEPTPGYDVLLAPEPLLSAIARWCWQAVLAVASHPVWALLACLAGWLVIATRRRVLDATMVGVWWLWARFAGPRELARCTLRLLEWRAWLYGLGRPAGATLGRWDALAGHDEFLTAACWALYGEGTTAPLPSQAIRAACCGVSRTTLRPARLADHQ